jgi:predicted HD superfamily hydrolase involved in NAD metabolism
MWTFDEIKDDLKKRLKETRFKHTLGVVDTSIRLSKYYGYSSEKASFAALLHDCGKLKNQEMMDNAVNKYPIVIDSFMLENKQLIHAPLGEAIARKRYGVLDEDILQAIRNHTVGNINMSKLDKIIYISDIIEPSRTFDNIDYLRKLALKDLDEACIACMDNTIRFLIMKHWMIDPNVIEARNTCIQNLKNKEK